MEVGKAAYKGKTLELFFSLIVNISAHNFLTVAQRFDRFLF